ncbi:helix-turn-helix domain-containing protein [Nonomuraea sp. NPDC049714]|uniref:helix-turn-helix domain-containing protein n=1 Tax=Nonomuraea sp. NPDC049714 TaxID=3364357 RepID=UPI00378D70C7
MSSPPAAPFHQRTELERAKRGWSKQELARHAGIGRVTYDRLAVNTVPPIARTVHKLCAVLDIDLAEGLRLAGLATEPLGDEPPQWARDLQETAASLQHNITRAGHILAAQGAMGWAYRGDLDQLQHALAAMGAEQLRELSAAATLLASVADEEMSSR